MDKYVLLAVVWADAENSMKTPNACSISVGVTLFYTTARCSHTDLFTPCVCSNSQRGLPGYNTSLSVWQLINVLDWVVMYIYLFPCLATCPNTFSNIFQCLSTVQHPLLANALNVPINTTAMYIVLYRREIWCAPQARHSPPYHRKVKARSALWGPHQASGGGARAKLIMACQGRPCLCALMRS